MHVLSYCLLLTFLSTDLKKNPLCTRKNSVAAIGSKITTITLNFFLFELTIVVRMLFLIMASELVCFFYRCLLEYKNVLVSALGGFHIYTPFWMKRHFIYLFKFFSALCKHFWIWIFSLSTRCAVYFWMGLIISDPFFTFMKTH